MIVSYVGYKTVIHHHDVYHAVPRILLAHDSITLKSVIVEGERTEGDLYSGTVTKLDPQAFEQQQSGSFGELANNLTGVSNPDYRPKCSETGDPRPAQQPDFDHFAKK